MALPRRAVASGLEPVGEQSLALLGALAAGLLRPAEELRQILVAIALGVSDVGLEPKRVAQALLDEPDHVVCLVLRACDRACFCSHSFLPESMFVPRLPKER